MQKSKSARPVVKASPDQLSRVDRKVGIELTENQLGQVTGGEALTGTGKTIKTQF